MLSIEDSELGINQYLLKYMCGCGGEMIFIGGNSLNSDPPQFRHQCSKCGMIEELDKMYPWIFID